MNDQERISLFAHVLPPYALSLAHIQTKDIIGIKGFENDSKEKDAYEPLKNQEELSIFLELVLFDVHMAARRAFNLVKQQDNEFIDKLYKSFIVGLKKLRIIPNAISEQEFIQKAEERNVEYFPIPEVPKKNADGTDERLGLLETASKNIVRSVPRLNHMHVSLQVFPRLLQPIKMINDILDNPQNPKV